MAQLLTDELWHQVEPLLPSHKPRPRGGRPPVDDRVALAGILFVLKTGIGWEDLPREIGCSGMTCWRRLRDWQAAGVWDALHRLLLDQLRGAERIDFSRVLVDSGSVRAVLGGNRPARAPRTAASSAASITLWSRLTGFRWRRSSPARTATTARS
jgi:transposase